MANIIVVLDKMRPFPGWMFFKKNPTIERNIVRRYGTGSRSLEEEIDHIDVRKHYFCNVDMPTFDRYSNCVKIEKPSHFKSKQHAEKILKKILNTEYYFKKDRFPELDGRVMSIEEFNHEMVVRKLRNEMWWCWDD